MWLRFTVPVSASYQLALASLATRWVVSWGPAQTPLRRGSIGGDLVDPCLVEAVGAFPLQRDPSLLFLLVDGPLERAADDIHVAFLAFVQQLAPRKPQAAPSHPRYTEGAHQRRCTPIG
jgi:hypothetical protein